MASTLRRNPCTVALALFMSFCGAIPSMAGEYEELAAKARAYRGATPVTAQPDGSILIEAEEFAPVGGDGKGWSAKNWGENYYAATFAITFLSRKAFLGAPEQGDAAAATIEVEVPKAGRYLALTRYEAAYRFETQFTLKIEQGGKVKLNRLYGSRDNVKLWAFSPSGGLKKEVGWYWGAVENTVWEGHDTFVDLEAGRAKITLIADKQPEPAAKRNVDAILLTTDVDGVKNRIAGEGYLPLDGLLTQAGDVFIRVHNAGSEGISVRVPNGTEHSPYWVHLRNWKPQDIAALPGKSSDWVEVGSLLDTMNDGQWTLTASPAVKDSPLKYTVEVGLRNAAGQIEPIASFEETQSTLRLAYDGNTRYSRRVRRIQSVLDDLMDYLAKNPVPGTPPTKSIIYCYTFDPIPGDNAYNAKIEEFKKMFSVNVRQDGDATFHGKPSGYIDVRGQSHDTLTTTLNKIVANGSAANIRTVSLGDEIGLPGPPGDAHAGFREFVKTYKLTPEDLVPGAGSDWEKVLYRPDGKTADENPRLYYYSRLFAQSYGINALKTTTDLIKSKLPNADTGANFSPHHGPAYLGEAHKFITLFRKGGMTMPWGEDYIWQIPIGSQQMNTLQIDMFRAANRYQPQRDIHFYVMPHWPGNTINSWRRMFYSSIAHGATIINLFEFRPVQVAYTENHVSLPEMYREVRRGFHELAIFEDIVQDGRVRWGNTAFWYSAAGDAWNNHRAPFGANKRSLYVAARHQQLQIDVVDEEDALKGTLKDYRVLYLADLNVSRTASKIIADWVSNGGHLFATASAGMYDESNQPNKILQELFGVNHTAFNAGGNIAIVFEKQDLPFAESIETVTWKSPAGEQTIPVYGMKSVFTPAGGEVVATFKDGTPAVTIRKAGKGQAVFCGFPVALSYFKPAIPMRPVDRGSTDDAMSHFIPTDFDAAASKLIGLPAEGVERPVVCSNPLVESTVLQSKTGIVIPLINWTGTPIKGLVVTVSSIMTKKATLASGGRITTREEGQTTIYTLDLDVADAIVLK